MTRRCDICGRGPRVMIKRTHAHKAVRVWQALNLQTVRIKGKKMRICMKCLKKLYKEGEI